MITEVMAWSSTKESPFTGADYFELSNFGSSDILMQGWFFSDAARLHSLISLPAITLPAGQSVIIARLKDSITNAENFTNWWGRAGLVSAMYPSPGFDERVGDEVWLYDEKTNVIDMVSFGSSMNGYSFVYDTNTGNFGARSAEGAGGGYKSAKGGDIGSPWTNSGPVPLSILKQPASQTNFPSEDVTLKVEAAGMPKPRLQWYFQAPSNSLWEPIPGATEASLTLTNVNTNNAGSYYIVLNNGLSTVSSVIATQTITVPTNCIPLTVLVRPQNIEAFPAQTAEFTVKARGYPPPSYQWQSNGVDLASETNATLIVGPVNLNMSRTIYSVRAWNACSSTNVLACLTVVPRANLYFTEIDAAPLDSNKKPWAELTNWGTNTVNLKGYRFSDTLPTDLKSANVMATITNDMVLKPGESVILVDSLSPDEFKLWWGEHKLLCDLKIFTFGGFSLSARGEYLRLWNQAATDPNDCVATVMWLSSTPGISLEVENVCDTNGCVGYALRDSVLYQNGAFRAAQDGDIGSPGYTSNAPTTLADLPVHWSAKIGSSATQKVCANGTPERSYQWRKDGTNLAGATNFSLVFTNVQSTEAGDYSVVVSNWMGSVTSRVATFFVLNSLVRDCRRTKDGQIYLSVDELITNTSLTILATDNLTTNLTHWPALLTTNASTTSMELTLPMSATPRFFRVKQP